jgi:hypothetical protein
MSNLSASNGDGNHDLLDAALDFHSRGLCVIPVKGKKPTIQWKQFQNRRPKKSELKAWFNNPKVTGLAVICGPVLGNLMIRDFDNPETYHQWAAEHPESATLPTVKTSRGFHVYCRTADAQRTVILADGELRGDGGYCVAPPSRHPEGGVYSWEVPLAKGPIPVVDIATTGLATIHQPTQQTQHPRHMYAYVKKSVEDAIRDSLPTEPGQRNQKLFHLARILKAIMPDASKPALRQIVRNWHREALPTIRTKDFDTSWIDFSWAWDQVKVPAGTPSWEQIESEAKAMPTPAAGLEYDTEPMRLLVALCATLDRHYGGQPFFLACRIAGEAIGVSHETANAMLRTLRSDGVLELVKKGPAKGTASTWRYRGREELA